MGVNLIFVLDGEPPELKWEEMARRNEVRFRDGGGRGRRCHKRGRHVRGGDGVVAGGIVKKKKVGRSFFKPVLKEV